MAEKNSKKISWVDLRKEYPHVTFDVWMKLADSVSLTGLDDEGMEILRMILEEENEKGEAAKAALNEVLNGRLKAISASMVHTQFRVRKILPRGIDKVHVQAYIVYGLLMPSSQRTFAASRKINPQTIRDFVERKLGRLFDQTKHETTEAWLIKQGVVNVSGGYTLNLKEKRKGVTPKGRKIILEAKRLMYEYRPNR